MNIFNVLLILFAILVVWGVIDGTEPLLDTGQLYIEQNAD